MMYYSAFDSFPTLKDFANGIGCGFDECDYFLCWIMKYINIWNICITEWTSILQMTNACFKIMLG